MPHCCRRPSRHCRKGLARGAANQPGRGRVSGAAHGLGRAHEGVERRHIARLQRAQRQTGAQQRGSAEHGIQLQRSGLTQDGQGTVEQVCARWLPARHRDPPGVRGGVQGAVSECACFAAAAGRWTSGSGFDRAAPLRPHRVRSRQSRRRAKNSWPSGRMPFGGQQSKCRDIQQHRGPEDLPERMLR